MRALSRNTVLALIGVTLVLHTAEEYLTFPLFLSSAWPFPQWLPPPGLLRNSQHMRVWLVTATVLPLLLTAWTMLRPVKALLVSVLFLEYILLVNAGWHMFAALVRGGYAPGVITAVLINLPFGIYVLRKALRERWIAARTTWHLWCSGTRSSRGHARVRSSYGAGRGTARRPRAGDGTRVAPHGPGTSAWQHTGIRSGEGRSIDAVWGRHDQGVGVCRICVPVAIGGIGCCVGPGPACLPSRSNGRAKARIAKNQ